MISHWVEKDILAGVSFLKDRLGERVFADGINLIDDPFRARGMGSKTHDGEGRAVAPTHLIEDGTLTRWLLNGASAKQLGLDPNGHASGGRLFQFSWGPIDQ